MSPMEIAARLLIDAAVAEAHGLDSAAAQLREAADNVFDTTF